MNVKHGTTKERVEDCLVTFPPLPATWAACKSSDEKHCPTNHTGKTETEQAHDDGACESIARVGEVLAQQRGPPINLRCPT